MLDNWGLIHLGKVCYELAIDEIRRGRAHQAHPALQRPRNSQEIGPIKAGKEAAGCSPSRWKAKRQRSCSSTPQQECHELGDHGTAFISEEMVRHEKKHADWFEGQLNAIERSRCSHTSRSSAATAPNERPQTRRVAPGPAAAIRCRTTTVGTGLPLPAEGVVAMSRWVPPRRTWTVTVAPCRCGGTSSGSPGRRPAPAGDHPGHAQHGGERGREPGQRLGGGRDGDGGSLSAVSLSRVSPRVVHHRSMRPAPPQPWCHQAASARTDLQQPVGLLDHALTFPRRGGHGRTVTPSCLARPRTRRTLSRSRG